MSGPVPEPKVTVGTSRREWIALLAGPGLWWGHFLTVYLLSEGVCAAASGGTGPTWLPVAILALTVLVLLVIAWAARQTWTYRRRGQLMTVGLGLDALFAVAVVMTGVPAVVLSPC